MVSKKGRVFADNIEAFGEVVDALLADSKTRDAFEENPMETLKEHGIVFPDPKLSEIIEKELMEAMPQIVPGADVMWTNPAVKVATKSTISLVSVAVSVDSQAKEMPEDIIRIDKVPVTRLRDTARMEARLRGIESHYPFTGIPAVKR